MKDKVFIYSDKVAKKSKIYISISKYFLTCFLTLLISFIVFLIFKNILNQVRINNSLLRSIEGIVLFIIVVFDFLYILFPTSLKFHSRLKAFYIDENDIYLISVSDLVLLIFETTLFLPRVNKNDKDNNLLKKIKYYIVGVLTSIFVFSKLRKNINKMKDRNAIIKFVKDPIFFKRSANVYRIKDVSSVKKYKNNIIVHCSYDYLTKNREIKDASLTIFNVYDDFSLLVKSIENKIK